MGRPIKSAETVGGTSKLASVNTALPIGSSGLSGNQIIMQAFVTSGSQPMYITSPEMFETKVKSFMLDKMSHSEQSNSGHSEIDAMEEEQSWTAPESIAALRRTHVNCTGGVPHSAAALKR